MVFSGYPVSSTNKKDSHDITVILLESGVKHHNHNPYLLFHRFSMKLVFLISILLISCMVRDALLIDTGGDGPGGYIIDGRPPTGIYRIRRDVRKLPLYGLRGNGRCC